MTEAIVKQESGTIARNEFSGTQLAVAGETVASVLAARAKAEVEARFIVAMQRPRDWDVVRGDLLRACERPGFAGSATEKIWGAAWYKKPIGEGVEGFSIRFAEEALRCMGNMDARSTVIWEDDRKRIVQVEVMDLENNISIPTTIVIEKTIERKYLKKGEVAISTRINSYGEPVHLREATADEVMQVQNSLTSKAMRNGILRLLPGDIQSECRNRIQQIRHGDIAKDPDGFKKRIADGFARHGINAAELKKYLGHDLASSSQAELAALRDLWKELDEGNTSWNEVIRAVAEEKGEDPPPAAPPEKPMDKLKKEMKGKQNFDSKPKSKSKGKLDPMDEIKSASKQLWGSDYQTFLGKFADKHKFKLSRLTDKQASELLDLLNKELEEKK
jgi:hypothetical protein